MWRMRCWMNGAGWPELEGRPGCWLAPQLLGKEMRWWLCNISWWEVVIWRIQRAMARPRMT